MPVAAKGCGGAPIVKLLSNRGFETFPGTGGRGKPFTGYLYAREPSGAPADSRIC